MDLESDAATVIMAGVAAPLDISSGACDIPLDTGNGLYCSPAERKTILCREHPERGEIGWTKASRSRLPAPVLMCGRAPIPPASLSWSIPTRRFSRRSRSGSSRARSGIISGSRRIFEAGRFRRDLCRHDSRHREPGGATATSRPSSIAAPIAVPS